MNILILGNATDAHTLHVNNALISAGATTEYFDISLFSTQLNISWRPDSR